MQALTLPLPVERPKLGEAALDLLSGLVYAVTHPVGVRDQVTNLVVDLIDAGPAAGNLIFRTSGAAAAATLPFSDPAFGNSTNGIATANPITSDTNAAGGTTDNFTAEDSTASLVFSGSVGTSGSGEDIELTSVNIGAGDTVQMTTLTYASMP